jgi:hypothetical protein
MVRLTAQPPNRYALKINDVPVEMAIFQGEGRGLSRTGTPVNLIKQLELILK